ncbi:MAG: hypothetical protein HS114_13030 [Anaerolineales bacterium]|nr:hypothetical protein [Anaerolineales bacterium]
MDGLSLKYGCTTPINAEAELARLMIERTHGQVIVVADHSKWGIVSNFEMARLDQIHLLVTNEGFETRRGQNWRPASSKQSLPGRKPMDAIPAEFE